MSTHLTKQNKNNIKVMLNGQVLINSLLSVNCDTRVLLLLERVKLASKIPAKAPMRNQPHHK